VRVERTGAERVFQRIGQEYASRIYGVDVVNSSDAAHFIVWKRDGLSGCVRAADVRMHFPRPQGPRGNVRAASALRAGPRRSNHPGSREDGEIRPGSLVVGGIVHGDVRGHETQPEDVPFPPR